MNFEHRAKNFIGSVSRAVGSDLVDYEFAEDSVILYFSTKIPSEYRTPIKALARTFLPECSFKVNSRRGLVTLRQKYMSHT